MTLAMPATHRGAELYIGGAWRGASGEPIDVIDPTTAQAIVAVPSADPGEIDAALSAARAAQPGWARTPAVRRGVLLREMADVIAAHAEPLAHRLVQEVGKPLSEARGEVAFAESFLRFNAEWDRRLEGEIVPGDVPGEVIHLLRTPVGVVAAINPWNFPLAVFFRKVAPALLTGNAVVAKPSEIAPLAILDAMRWIAESVDLPAGVLNVVTGGPETGKALVDAPLVDLVSFTGHRDTGKAVMAAAARHLTRVSLELGGKAPAIVWKDADLDQAVGSIVEARHTNAGQVCTSAERVLVHESVLEEFTDRYVRAVRALRVGDPATDPDMGPQVSAAQHAKTAAAVQRAIQEGADVLAGGGRPAGAAFSSGYWYEPTVLAGVRRDMEIMSEEVFGPVTPIIGVRSLDEALELANDSRYGLSAYLFSRNYRTVMRVVDDLQFGEIYVNRTLGESVHAHHAGMKESGIGGEDGKWGILRYTQIKTAYHHYG